MLAAKKKDVKTLGDDLFDGLGEQDDGNDWDGFM